MSKAQVPGMTLKQRLGSSLVDGGAVLLQSANFIVSQKKVGGGKRRQGLG